MNTIPVEILIKIEADRPDLAPMIHDLMATTDAELTRVLEKRLADAYMSGASRLAPEETLWLSACCAGRKYGDIDRSLLH